MNLVMDDLEIMNYHVLLFLLFGTSTSSFSPVFVIFDGFFLSSFVIINSY